MHFYIFKRTRVLEYANILKPASSLQSRVSSWPLLGPAGLARVCLCVPTSVVSFSFLIFFLYQSLFFAGLTLFMLLTACLSKYLLPCVFSLTKWGSTWRRLICPPNSRQQDEKGVRARERCNLQRLVFTGTVPSTQPPGDHAFNTETRRNILLLNHNNSLFLTDIISLLIKI